MAVLGRRFCVRAFSSCGKRGPLFIAVRGPLTIAASLIAEHRLQTRRLSNCGSWAQPLRGTWDLPRPGLEPVSPALAGRLSTTAPPGKPGRWILNHCATREAPKRLSLKQSWLGPERVGEWARLLPAALALLVKEEEDHHAASAQEPRYEAAREPTNPGLSHAVWDNPKVMCVTGFLKLHHFHESGHNLLINHKEW